MKIVTKKGISKRRHDFIAGAASAFNIAPTVGIALAYGDVGMRRDAKNLSCDWERVGQDIYKGMKKYGKFRP